MLKIGTPRCGIPVVIMGETGCGKTCLIRYMCGLQSGPGGPKNMLLMKVQMDLFYELLIDSTIYSI